MRSLLHVSSDEVAVSAHSVRFERHPELQRAEASRQLDAAVGKGKAAGHDAAWHLFKVAGSCGEGSGVKLRIPHQHAADLEGQVDPFVQVEGERVCLLDAADECRVILAEAQQRSERSVDVKPETVTAANLGESGEVIDSAGIDCVA